MNLELLWLILTYLGQLNPRIQNYHDFSVLTGEIPDFSDNALNVELSRQIKLLNENEEPRHQGQLQFKTQEQFFKNGNEQKGKNGNEQTNHDIPLLNFHPSRLRIKWETKPRIEIVRKQNIASPDKMVRTSWYQTGVTFQQTPGTSLQNLVDPLKQTSGHPEQHITGNNIHQLVRLRRQTMNRSPTEVMAGTSTEQQSRRQQVLQRIFHTPTQEQRVSGGNNARTFIPQMLTNNGQSIRIPDQRTLGTLEQFRRNVTQQQAVRTPQQMVGTQGQPNTGLFLTQSEHPLSWTNRQAVGTLTGQMPETRGQMVGRPGQIIARIPAQHTLQTTGQQILGSSTNGQQVQALETGISNQWPFSFQMARSPVQQVPQRFQIPITRTSRQQNFRNPILQMIRNSNGQVVGLLGQQLTETLSQQARSLPNQLLMNQSPGTRAAGSPFVLFGTQSISPIQQTRSITSPSLSQGSMAVRLAGTQTTNNPSRSTLNIIGLDPVRNGISALGPAFTVFPGQDIGGNSMMGSSRFSSSLDQGMQLSSPFSSGSSMGSEAMGMDIRNNFAMDSSSARPEFLRFLRRSRASMPMFDGQSSIPQTLPQMWPGEPLFSMMPQEGFDSVPGVPLGFGPGRPLLQPMLDMSLEGFGSLFGEPTGFRSW